MSDRLVDANVAVKWVIAQTHSDRARQLFEDTVVARGRLFAPPLLLAEVSNTIYQHQRSRDPRWHISAVEARAALERFLALPVVLLAPYGLYERAFAFALEHGFNTTYDSVYVVLAQILGVEMWTDDQALLRVLGSGVPWVHSLADYPLPRVDPS
jgi:predicted nucleic acid-binding protein